MILTDLLILHAIILSGLAVLIRLPPDNIQQLEVDFEGRSFD